MQVRIGLIATVVAAVFGCLCSTAFAAVTPGWECVPTTAGQAVTSGGTGASPSCGSGSTPVLAPTYVSAGVGGKATAQFSGVNVQVVNGSGSETTLNGEGNLVIGYDPGPGTQTGSHNLVLGTGDQTYTSWGGIDAGIENQINAPGASVLGGAHSDVAATAAYATISGGETNGVYGEGDSISGGFDSKAEGLDSSVAGGLANDAKDDNSSITGGAYNVAADDVSSITGGCDNLTGSGTPPSYPCGDSGLETVTGGAGNAASGLETSVSGGTSNIASGPGSSASGGWQNTASGQSSWVGGGHGNNPSGWAGSISGGESNKVSSAYSLGSILGGFGNGVSGNCGTFPATGESC